MKKILMLLIVLIILPNFSFAISFRLYRIINEGYILSKSEVMVIEDEVARYVVRHYPDKFRDYEEGDIFLRHLNTVVEDGMERMTSFDVTVYFDGNIDNKIPIHIELE